jgi:hypothetical protein
VGHSFHRVQLALGGVELPLVHASAQSVPLSDASFDIVFCDHGGMSFADPYRTVPEVARLLRRGGLFAFSHTSAIAAVACALDADEAQRIDLAVAPGMIGATPSFRGEKLLRRSERPTKVVGDALVETADGKGRAAAKGGQPTRQRSAQQGRSRRSPGRRKGHQPIAISFCGALAGERQGEEGIELVIHGRTP